MMKALLLAAGKGSRISRYLSGKPKCTVDIGNEVLIHYTVKLLQSRGIKDIAIVLGYHADDIKKCLTDINEIQYFYNPFYDVTNSIASAWFAKTFINDELIIMNADVFMEGDLLDEILNTVQNPVLFSDETRKEEADFKLYYEDGVLLKYGKELSGTDITGEYVGVVKLSGSFLSIFNANLETMIRQQKHFVWWENVLYSLIGVENIFVKDVQGKFWAEVDYIEDYERILKFRKYEIDYEVKVRKSLETKS